MLRGRMVGELITLLVGAAVVAVIGFLLRWLPGRALGADPLYDLSATEAACRPGWTVFGITAPEVRPAGQEALVDDSGWAAVTPGALYISRGVRMRARIPLERVVRLRAARLRPFRARSERAAQFTGSMTGPWSWSSWIRPSSSSRAGGGSSARWRSSWTT